MNRIVPGSRQHGPTSETLTGVLMQTMKIYKFKVRERLKRKERRDKGKEIRGKSGRNRETQR